MSTYRINGKPVSREEFLRRKLGGEGLPMAQSTKWPLLSDGAGIDPSQIPEYREALQKYHGVDTQFTAEGQAIFRDRKHRAAHLKACGFFDKDGCYGDG
jgi:hypothetical protein